MVVYSACKKEGNPSKSCEKITDCNTNNKFRKCNTIDKIIWNMDNKTLSLKCERSFL